MKKRDYKPDIRFGFVDVEDACNIIGVSPSWVYKATATRKLTHYKVGGRLLFKISDLIDFVEKNKQESI